MAYRGAQDQGSAATEFNSIDFIVDRKLGKVSTATLVKIVKAPYDKQGNAITPGSAVPIGYVDVLPLVNQLDGFGKAVPHTTVFHLSYFRYQGGNGAFISDPIVGDIGKMVVADRDTSTVRATDAQANPGSLRRFDRADGTFFGQTQSAAPQQWFAFLTKGFNCTDLWGNTLIGNQDGVVVNGVTITRSGDVISKTGVHLNTHVHKDGGGVGDSGSPEAPS